MKFHPLSSAEALLALIGSMDGGKGKTTLERLWNDICEYRLGGGTYDFYSSVDYRSQKPPADMVKDVNAMVASGMLFRPKDDALELTEEGRHGSISLVPTPALLGLCDKLYKRRTV
jgi:hypothetical protein